MKSLMAASETRLVVVPILLEVVLKGPAAALAAAMFSPARVWQAFSNMLCMYLP